MKKLNIILIVSSMLVSAGCSKAFEEEPLNNQEAIFEDLWSEFNRHYAVFEERGVNWDEQYAYYRPLVSSSTTDAELTDIFKQMLTPLNDAHIDFVVPNQRAWKANAHVDMGIEDDLFNLDIIKENYLNNDFFINGDKVNTYGWIGDVGYVHMKWVSDNMFVFPDILDFFKDAKGLIIDYRHNGGGQHMWGFENAGRLTQETRFTHRVKTKNGTGPADFTEWFEWHLEPEGEYFDKPIVFLTDRYTISAAERMTYAMKTLPNVIHMGDTTNGSIGTKVPRELANGWKYSIVTQKVEGFDGVFYEGSGIPPEVYIKNTSEEMAQGVDRTLETALETF